MAGLSCWVGAWRAFAATRCPRGLPCRVSGAFVVNSRRQSLALDAAVPGSPFGLTDTPDDCLSDLELNDDEFAAEEQAHRWAARGAPSCVGALRP